MDECWGRINSPNKQLPLKVSIKYLSKPPLFHSNKTTHYSYGTVNKRWKWSKSKKDDLFDQMHLIPPAMFVFTYKFT